MYEVVAVSREAEILYWVLSVCGRQLVLKQISFAIDRIKSRRSQK